MNQYVGVLLMLIASSGFLIFMLMLSVWFGPKASTPTKLLPFECGAVSVGDVTEQRFSVGFYIVAMVFILFDIEVIFLYPWAVVLLDLGWSGFLVAASFIMILSVGLVYVWRKGVLDWSEL